MINSLMGRVPPLQSRIAYYADALSILIGREFAIRYKGSMLGLLWTVLNPLATVAILYLIFTRIVPLDIPNYSSFVYTGLLPWTWFSSAVQLGSSTLLDNRDLVRKPFFTRSLLPMVVVGTNFLLYMFALPVLMALLTLEGIAITPALLLLPIVWVVQAIFTLACAMLMAALSVIVRDVQHLLGIALMLWFYLTPIFYNTDRLPPGITRWYVLNPMTVIIQSHRTIAIAGFAPAWDALGGVAAISALLLVFSYAVFRILEDTFVEEL